MYRMSILFVGLAAILSLVVVVQAQHGYGSAMEKRRAAEKDRQDRREVLRLSAEAEAGMKLTMREHLQALQAIVAGLGRQDFEQAPKVAHQELGFPKHHQAMQREAGAEFPSKYQELAMAHHQEAEDLANVIASKDLQRILPSLERTIGACVACHRAYKS